ncbi:LOW QUALITY PROTEIN: mucosal pentraxin-like [Sphaeramia orbicularis]|uniref:LOW QUALITY PROTEIN: mucosal pentraxin-like n=1 Tax=Sphaeramia orbicularis TaxID=375764 RepID=UPI001180133B|nr:LOW QUALITY PROTEIN: mucosal pentraxin-like [Sphaeramia orbicularis]
MVFFCFLLFAMLTAVAAIPQDLSGKMFIFPQPTNTAQVMLTTSIQNFSAFTVCFRSFTDLRRVHSFFSLATPSVFNEIRILKSLAADVMDFYIRGNNVEVAGQGYKLNTWQSICTTWDSASGLVQLWLDGKPSSRKFISSGSNISGPIVIVLGQDQDSFGGGFDAAQSFVGMMSDVYMWDYVLSPCEIQRYMDERNFPTGNVLNWGALEFVTMGRVLIENKQSLYCK